MADQTTADEASNIIVSWDTDDDCSDEDDMYFANSFGEDTADDCSNLAVQYQMPKAVTIVTMRATVNKIISCYLKLQHCHLTRCSEETVLCGNVFHPELPEESGHITFLLPLPVFQEQLQEVLRPLMMLGSILFMKAS